MNLNIGTTSQFEMVQRLHALIGPEIKQGMGLLDVLAAVTLVQSDLCSAVRQARNQMLAQEAQNGIVFPKGTFAPEDFKN